VHGDVATAIRGLMCKIEHFSSADCRIINNQEGQEAIL
jgi:hypothetical protein